MLQSCYGFLLDHAAQCPSGTRREICDETRTAALLDAILGAALVIPVMGDDIVSVLAGSGSGGRGDAMRDAIREQALGKGFQCDGC